MIVKFLLGFIPMNMIKLQFKITMTIIQGETHESH